MKQPGPWKAAGFLSLCLAAPITSSAQTFTVLANFDGFENGGCVSGLAEGFDGNFYGTTCVSSSGTVFKVTPDGVMTRVHYFGSVVDGIQPLAGVVQATTGYLYGTTYLGGPNNYHGTIFRVSLSGEATTLHRLTKSIDGAHPLAGLIQATDGNLYGTTYDGGPWGGGTVFRITPEGAFTVLHHFRYSTGSIDGGNPRAPLIEASDGNFYGTTYNGGVNGLGTIFRITPTGSFTTIHGFSQADGIWPISGLVQAADGYLYGTTNRGGANKFGTVYRISLTGEFTTLHDFEEDVYVNASLIQATDGNLYGITAVEPGNGGTIFKITPNNELIRIYTLNPDGSDGAGAAKALLQATDGNLYGTTTRAGAFRYGTVFRLSLGLDPFVKTLPRAAAMGSVVNIQGNNLTGATNVTFNDVPAVFTVVSPSLITATVPVGATTGKVRVTTPGGILSSDVDFRVVEPVTSGHTN